MEKKRRARINNCLNELKNLLLEAMKKDPARHSKLEKADILEMTVRHLQQLKQRQRHNIQSEPEVQTKYGAGFRECADEVQRYVNRFDGMESPVKQRLLNHLSNCVKGFRSPSTKPSTAAGIYLNNNGVMLNLTPSRLPSGEVAFVLPREWTNNNNESNDGLLMTSQSRDTFPPLSINCSSSSSASPSTSASGESVNGNSPTNSDYSVSESSAIFNNFTSRFNAFQQILSNAKRHQADVRPPIINIDRISQWQNVVEFEEAQLPVDLSHAKDGESMWRPW